MIAWFAVHCTSMNNTNRLISGDNKGYASYLMEKEINYPAEAEYRPFSSPQWAERVANGSLFVAAFAQSNEVNNDV
jgi:neutral ceramidase